MQQFLKDYFDGKKSNNGIKPFEAHAYSAVIHGSILSGVGGEEPKGTTFIFCYYACK